VLFEDLAFLEYALGLLAVNAPFSKPEEGVVAPFDRMFTPCGQALPGSK